MKNLQELRNKRNEIEKIIAPFEAELNDINDEIDSLEANLEESIKEQNKEVVNAFEEAGAEFVNVRIDESDDKRSICEDDGALIINIGKISGCFICNQELSKSEWNKLARPIVKQFGFSWSDL